VRHSVKVQDNKVIGFEPWEEFPVNHGMLCPKGVKRYLQNEHPDRLLAPLVRTENGFAEATWDEALGRTAAAIAKFRPNTAPTRLPCSAARP
jgi:assimilatory nitrate reductase catalytic subunit